MNHSRKNKDNKVVKYVQLAHNVRNPKSGSPQAEVIHSFGRMDVSRSGYYKWLKRQSGALNSREQENQQIGRLLRQGYQDVKGRYGYRRMKIWLEREHGIQVNHKRVYRLLKSMDLQSRIRRKKIRWKKEEQYAPNVLNREFKADQPFRKLVTDITYVYAGSRRFYLSVIRDIFNNEVVAYHLWVE